MTPFYSDDWLTILQGDVRDVLPTLPPESVDCIVTSPPYWGLRDYGTASWSGGDEDCDHREPPSGIRGVGRDRAASGGTFHDSATPGLAVGVSYRDICGKCGAVRQDSQIGLERTPEEYVANLVAIFRELRRVLKSSGTCWLNLGDSYAGGGTMGRNDEGRRVSDGAMREGWKSTPNMGNRPAAVGLKPKDLVGIPWRVAFALQADGWYLRSDIVWNKSNPMPESVTDRPTKSHEYLFLLTKSAKYYFDADAVREEYIKPFDNSHRSSYRPASSGGYDIADGSWTPKGDAGLPLHPAGRNLRSVWTIATRPYPGSHFAVFPPELPERCIKAGSSERGVCPECGAPWERVVERVTAIPQRVGEWKATGEEHRNDIDRKGGFYPDGPTTTGWRPSCRHETLKPAPAVVLDPFAGSGTTGMVANRLSRRAILIDLNGDYLKQQLQRNAQTPLGLGAA